MKHHPSRSCVPGKDRASANNSREKISPAMEKRQAYDGSGTAHRWVRELVHNIELQNIVDK